MSVTTRAVRQISNGHARGALRHFGACTVLAVALDLAQVASGASVLIEAENFKTLGGWVVDQQFMDQMGSSYLLAHGLGVPVTNAVTEVTVPEAGVYRVWVRTKDWVPPYHPGRFKVIVAGKPLEPEFGTEGKDWLWQNGGTAQLAAGKAGVELQDLTGFEGRCDAIYLTTDANEIPPDKPDEAMRLWRKKQLGLPATPPNAGEYDLVVVGGGMGGCASALAAVRGGLRVALIQDRPVLGGNNSSEVRVWLGGGVGGAPFPNNGGIVKELAPPTHGYGATGKGYEQGDEKKRKLLSAEKNLSLFLNHRVFAVEKNGARIAAAVSKHIQSGEELRFVAPLFVDCTGDGNLGFLAGAEFRCGREGKEETGERTAPPKSDGLHMGPSNLWGGEDVGQPSVFPSCPWALKSRYVVTQGDWTWESGFSRDPIGEAELIRDHNFRAMYGTWDYVKNGQNGKYANWKLTWCAYVAGKRESRRLVGDYVLTQTDIQEKKVYPDGCVTTTWSLDLHSPPAAHAKLFPGEEFRSCVAGGGGVSPYPIPFRCLYSKNIPNLMMAGRNISVTHVALGTVRVMNTIGMMGVVTGRAAVLCKKFNCGPRDLYATHLEEFKHYLAEPTKDSP